MLLETMQDAVIDLVSSESKDGQIGSEVEKNIAGIFDSAARIIDRPGAKGDTVSAQDALLVALTSLFSVISVLAVQIAGDPEKT